MMTRWRRWVARAVGAGRGEERSDPMIWAAAVLLTLISLIGLRSASVTQDASMMLRQAMWAVVGATAAYGVSRVRYTHWLDLGVLMTPVTVAFLLAVFVAGTEKLGASR